jgi:L-aminopeptidase/D-esterase-like protein
VSSATALSPVDLVPFGIAVGHATDAEGATGLTVVRGVGGPLRASAAVVGRATGTRELGVLEPTHLTGRVDAVLLAGGSAYGLDAAAGVMRWMEERGRGFSVGPGVVPIVPAAVIFDLAPLGRFDARPTPAMAYAACEDARSDGVAEGSVGAGTGATVGKAAGPAWAMKGGFGCAVAAAGEGADRVSVAALAVVNAFGDVRDATGAIIAGSRRADGGFADTAAVLASRPGGVGHFEDVAARNTTLAVVAVTAPLERVELYQLARGAAAALFRRITPAGTSFDGDVVFAVCPWGGRADTAERDTAERDTPRAGAPPQLQDAADAAPSRDRFAADSVHAAHSARLALVALEALAGQALERAIERAVRLARGRDGVPGLADGAGPGHVPRALS